MAGVNQPLGPPPESQDRGESPPTCPGLREGHWRQAPPLTLRGSCIEAVSEHLPDEYLPIVQSCFPKRSVREHRPPR